MVFSKRVFLCFAFFCAPVLAQTLDTQQAAFLTLINEYRAQNGVGPLQVSVALQNSSQWMATDMATNNYLAHTDSLGRTADVRIQAFGYPYYPWGENIAGGFSDAQSTFTFWQNACDPDSSGNCTYAHRLNMLNGAFKVMGIGRFYSGSSMFGWYWATDFGGVVDQLLGSAPPAPSIGSFTASPTTVTAGQATTLSWSVTGSGVILTLDNGIGDVSTLTSKPVSPSATTTYTLTAANSGGSVTSSVTVTVNSASSPPPQTFSTIRINSGGPSYTDPQGNVWSADQSGSASYTYSTGGSVANTSTPTLYQTCRWGAAINYQFPVPNGTYTVTLKFAEPSMSGPGQRLFNVALNGSAVLSNFDVFAAAGGAMIALDKSFPVTVSGGQIAIQFSAGSADYPLIDAIEIDAGSGGGGGSNSGGGGGAVSVARVNAGGGAVTDASGNTWAADNSYSGGTPWSTGQNISNTSTPALYQSCRYGSSFSYQFVVPNGNYNVTLKFAEVSRTGPGQRVFNVAINGTPVLTNFDVFAQAGGALIALDEVFPVTVSGGQITIQFTSGPADYPLINAISVTQGNAPVRIHAGGSAVTDAVGNVWSADSSYSGGNPWSTSQNIANTASPALYQSCRYGDGFSYQFNVANGSFNVLLKFAEVSRTAAGQRIFSVVINGTTVLTNFDIFAAAGGPLIAIDRSFPVTVTNGQITIQFVTGPADLPMINAIQIQ
jgi:uncharacterized protein YkwD